MSRASDDFGRTTAIILAGGLGTRLRAVAPDIQKVVAPVGERPFLFRLLERIEPYPFAEILICAGYRADTLQEAMKFRTGDIPIRFLKEEQPLGTGGALRNALEAMHTPAALAMNGDSFCDVSFPALLESFYTRLPPLLMTVCEFDDTSRYGVIEQSVDKYVTAFRERGECAGRGWINAGVYCIDRAQSEAFFPPQEAFSLERDVFPRMVQCRKIAAFQHAGRFIDIGTPESYRQAEEFFS